MSSKVVGGWTAERALEVLATRAALAAMRGKSQPVTVAVIARLEQVVSASA